jgi:hypothetical protein
VVKPNERQPDAPIDQPCAHELPQASSVGFRR